MLAIFETYFRDVDPNTIALYNSGSIICSPRQEPQKTDPTTTCGCTCDGQKPKYWYFHNVDIFPRSWPKRNKRELIMARWYPPHVQNRRKPVYNQFWQHLRNQNRKIWDFGNSPVLRHFDVLTMIFCWNVTFLGWKPLFGQFWSILCGKTNLEKKSKFGKISTTWPHHGVGGRPHDMTPAESHIIYCSILPFQK
jgi:hypothetical protein